MKRSERYAPICLTKHVWIKSNFPQRDRETAPPLPLKHSHTLTFFFRVKCHMPEGNTSACTAENEQSYILFEFRFMLWFCVNEMPHCKSSLNFGFVMTLSLVFCQLHIRIDTHNVTSVQFLQYKRKGQTQISMKINLRKKTNRNSEWKNCNDVIAFGQILS